MTRTVQLNLKLDNVEWERLSKVALHLGVSRQAATRQIMKEAYDRLTPEQRTAARADIARRAAR